MANESNRERGTLPAEELSLFCEQIGIALAAGIPLHDAMDTLCEEDGAAAGQELLSALRTDVIETGSIADAMERSAGFPQYLVSMARIGERAGKLDDVMAQLAVYYRWEAEVRRSVRAAVTYPAVMVLMLIAVIAVLLISVLPVFERTFAGLGLDLAGSAAMKAGMVIGEAALVVMVLALVFVVATVLLLRTDKRAGVMRFLGKSVPAIGKTVRLLDAGRFASVIEIMLVSGYGLEEAMTLAGTVLSDSDYAAAVQRCGAALTAGGSFAETVAKEKLFNEMQLKLVRVGAAAGQVDTVMHRITEDCRLQSDEAIGRLVGMIEPTLVTVLSVVIGGILLSVMLPLLSLLSGLFGT